MIDILSLTAPVTLSSEEEFDAERQHYLSFLTARVPFMERGRAIDECFSTCSAILQITALTAGTRGGRRNV